MTELIEIRDSLTRQEETGKSILAHIERITKDIDKIKDDLGDHGKEITLIQAEAKFARETVATNKAEIWEETRKIWEVQNNRRIDLEHRIDALKQDREMQCDRHAAEFNKALAAASADVFKDVKLWVIISAGTFLLAGIGGVLYVGRLFQRVDYLEASIKTIQGVVK